MKVEVIVIHTTKVSDAAEQLGMGIRDVCHLMDDGHLEYLCAEGKTEIVTKSLSTYKDKYL